MTLTLFSRGNQNPGRRDGLYIRTKILVFFFFSWTTLHGQCLYSENVYDMELALQPHKQNKKLALKTRRKIHFFVFFPSRTNLKLLFRHISVWSLMLSLATKKYARKTYANMCVCENLFGWKKQKQRRKKIWKDRKVKRKTM